MWIVDPRERMKALAFAKVYAEESKLLVDAIGWPGLKVAEDCYEAAEYLL